MTTPINFNITKFNDESEPIDFKYKEPFNEAFLDKASNYQVAVTRLQVPTSEIETFVMSDNNLFKVYLSCTDSSNVYSSVGTQLPDENDDFDANINYGTVNYYSNDDVLERISRIMYFTFVKCCKLRFGNSYLITSDRTSDVNSLSFMSSSITSIHQDITVSSSLTRQIADLKFNIHELLLSTTNFSSSIDTYSASYNGLVRIKIKSPTNVETVVAVFNSAQLYKNTNKPSAWASNKILTLTEESFRSICCGYDGIKATKTNEHYLPTESFIKFSGIVPNGTWRITLETSTAVFGRLRYSVNFTTVESTFPVIPPSISIDTDTKLVISYHEKFVTNNIMIGFSPRLKELIDFGHTNMLFNSANQFFQLIFPNYVLTGTDALVNLKQNNSTRYLLCNLTKVIILSASIPSDPEYGASRSAKHVLSDFTIDTETDSLGVLSYSETAGVYPWRRYKLRSSISFSNFDIEVLFEYNNGLTKVARLAPGQTGSLRLSFFNMK